MIIYIQMIVDYLQFNRSRLATASYYISDITAYLYFAMRAFTLR